MKKPSAFSEISARYDAEFSLAPQTVRIRSRIESLMTRFFATGTRILELGCGTGIDAHALLANGCTVIATDPAAGMLSIAKQRCAGHAERVSFVRMQAEHTGCFREQSFDGILSNFGGLNCVEDLHAVFDDAFFVLRDNGVFILCLMNRFSFSEMMAYVHRGQFRAAFRRWKARGVHVSVGSQSVLVWYHSLRTIRKMIRGKFTIMTIVGLNILTPPPAFARWYASHPLLYKTLARVEDLIDALPFAAVFGDHIAIVLERFE